METAEVALNTTGGDTVTGTSCSEPRLKLELRQQILKRRRETGQADIAADFTVRPVSELSAEERMKKCRRQEQNRRAARKFRSKKRSLEISVKERYEEEASRNQLLRADVEALQAYVTMARAALSSHLTSHCRMPPQCYLQSRCQLETPSHLESHSVESRSHLDFLSFEPPLHLESHSFESPSHLDSHSPLDSHSVEFRSHLKSLSFESRSHLDSHSFESPSHQEALSHLDSDSCIASRDQQGHNKLRLQQDQSPVHQNQRIQCELQQQKEQRPLQETLQVSQEQEQQRVMQHYEKLEPIQQGPHPVPQDQQNQLKLLKQPQLLQEHGQIKVEQVFHTARKQEEERVCFQPEYGQCDNFQEDNNPSHSDCTNHNQQFILLQGSLSQQSVKQEQQLQQQQCLMNNARNYNQEHTVCFNSPPSDSHNNHNNLLNTKCFPNHCLDLVPQTATRPSAQCCITDDPEFSDITPVTNISTPARHGASSVTQLSSSSQPELTLMSLSPPSVVPDLVFSVSSDTSTSLKTKDTHPSPVNLSEVSTFSWTSAFQLSSHAPSVPDPLSSSLTQQSPRAVSTPDASCTPFMLQPPHTLTVPDTPRSPVILQPVSGLPGLPLSDRGEVCSVHRKNGGSLVNTPPPHSTPDVADRDVIPFSETHQRSRSHKHINNWDITSIKSPHLQSSPSNASSAGRHLPDESSQIYFSQGHIHSEHTSSATDMPVQAIPRDASSAGRHLPVRSFPRLHILDFVHSMDISSAMLRSSPRRDNVLEYPLSGENDQVNGIYTPDIENISPPTSRSGETDGSGSALFDGRHQTRDINIPGSASPAVFSPPNAVDRSVHASSGLNHALKDIYGAEGVSLALSRLPSGDADRSGRVSSTESHHGLSVTMHVETEDDSAAMSRSPTPCHADACGSVGLGVQKLADASRRSCDSTPPQCLVCKSAPPLSPHPVPRAIPRTSLTPPSSLSLPTILPPHHLPSFTTPPSSRLATSTTAPPPRPSLSTTPLLRGQDYLERVGEEFMPPSTSTSTLSVSQSRGDLDTTFRDLDLQPVLHVTSSDGCHDDSLGSALSSDFLKFLDSAGDSVDFSL